MRINKSDEINTTKRYIETIAEMQSIELEMMKSVHMFCVEHSIRYSLAFGSLLGAVRHKGFIPWDDDIDIMMPRPDYERFIKSFSASSYQVVSLHDQGYCYPYAKIFDARTRLEEVLRYSYEDLGVFIDIFPVDGLCQDKKHQKKRYRSQRLLYRAHMTMKYPYSQEWSLGKRIAITFGRLLEIVFPIEKLLNTIDRRARQIEFAASAESAVMIGDSTLATLPANSFDQLLAMPFCDTEFLVVPTYEEHLYALYGEFMRLPPEEERKSDHRFRAFWKDS